MGAALDKKMSLAFQFDNEKVEQEMISLNTPVLAKVCFISPKRSQKTILSIIFKSFTV